MRRQRLHLFPSPIVGDTLTAGGQPAVAVAVERRRRRDGAEVVAELEPDCPDCGAPLAWLDRAARWRCPGCRLVPTVDDFAAAVRA